VIESAQKEPVDPRWPLVRALVTLDEVDSTSDHAAALAREGNLDLPFAVWARRQTRGRGRGSHSWWSDAGSLTFTLAIDPIAHGIPVESEPKLALATAVGVIQALGDLELAAPSAGIRWPNDLEVDGKKFGGILPERIEIPDGHRILVGVGLNVRTNLADAPLDVVRMATSLAANPDGPPIVTELSEVLRVILGGVEDVLSRMARGDRSLADQWAKLDLLKDRWVSVDLGTRVVSGRARGIDRDGALRLETEGETLQLFGGQVLRP
jgi:BirA family transcriptional regulator, biotin operon repressor / biotin---[acetyl-CoA-carboxylase] ligase